MLPRKAGSFSTQHNVDSDLLSSSCKQCILTTTVDQDFFSGKIFRRLNFPPGFTFVTMTTWQYELTPIIRRRKYFVGLIFIVEGDWLKFFATKISQSTVDYKSHHATTRTPNLYCFHVHLKPIKVLIHVARELKTYDYVWWPPSPRFQLLYF